MSATSPLGNAHTISSPATRRGRVAGKFQEQSTKQQADGGAHLRVKLLSRNIPEIGTDCATVTNRPISPIKPDF
jgi:hypothetical protein